MHIAFIKTPGGWANGDSKTEEFHRKTKLGNMVHGDIKQMRNAAFHRKFFALLNLAFEYWNPGEINHEYGTPEKNFERFRKDLTILAGYYHIVIRLDGTAKPEADSIKFGRMDQATFDALYQNVLSVIMKKINVLNKLGEDEINNLVDKFLEFE